MNRLREVRRERFLESVRKIPPARAVTQRKCLRCGNAFKSEGPQHRMCTACRALPTDWP